MVFEDKGKKFSDTDEKRENRGRNSGEGREGGKVKAGDFFDIPNSPFQLLREPAEGDFSFGEWRNEKGMGRRENKYGTCRHGAAPGLNGKRPRKWHK